MKYVIWLIMLAPFVSSAQKIYSLGGVQLTKSEYTEMFAKFRREYIVDNGAVVPLDGSGYYRMECDVVAVRSNNLILAKYNGNQVAIKLLDAESLRPGKKIYIYGHRDGDYQAADIRRIDMYTQVPTQDIMPGQQQFYDTMNNNEEVFNSVRPVPAAPPPATAAVAPARVIAAPPAPARSQLRGPRPAGGIKMRNTYWHDKIAVTNR